jgi:AraC-like DNA-binding protein
MSTKALAALRRAAAKLPDERYVVDRPVDARGQYRFELAGEFPLALRRLSFVATDPAPPLTWHTYLELFILLSPECRLQMGGQEVVLGAGDVLVMDHLKLHAVTGFPGRAEAIVVRFMPEIVRGIGTAAADHLLLLPFLCQREDTPHVVRTTDAAAPVVLETLAHVIGHCAQAGQSPYWQTGARGYFLLLLHHLAQHCGAAEQLKERFDQQKTKTHRLRAVFEYIGENYANRISLPQMAAVARLSRPQFHTVFKRATGMTLVDYLTQVRLTHAARLLQQTDRSIAEIASAVGFADQSYFDRRFRRHYGRTPRVFRQEASPALAR